MVSYPSPKVEPTSFVQLRTVVFFVSWMAANAVRSKVRGIKSKFVFGDTLVGDGVGRAVYEEFLPGALEQGSYIAVPEPMVVGRGLEAIQEAFEVQRKGVSAKKVVVGL